MFALIDSLKKNRTDFLRQISSAQLGTKATGKEKVERGMHSICPRWDAALGRPVAAVTRVLLLCAVSMSQVLGNAHAAFGLGQ